MRKITLLLAICLSYSLNAKVVMPSVFTDNMILQQQSDFKLYGKAAPNKKMTVHTGWDKKSHSLRSDAAGNWKIQLSTPTAGGPHKIEISDGTKLTLQNVMVGEVWFCSGQSNMEMPVAGWGRVMNYEQEVANANYPNIRLFQVKKATSLKPNEDVTSTMGGWKECSPQSIPEFSSVAYFFARKLHSDLNIPIGVIDCTWGGTPAEAWCSYNTLKDVYGYTDEMKNLSRLHFDTDKVQAQFNTKKEAWETGLRKRDKGYAQGSPVWSNKEMNDTDWGKMTLPGYWEKNGLPNFDGMVWFRKNIDIPQSWAGKDLTLSLAVIDDEDIVFWNGKQVAQGSGYATQRVYTIPGKEVKAGNTTITVRVADYGGEGGIYGNAKDMFLTIKGGHSISLAGEWKYKVGTSIADYPKMPVSPLGSSSYPTVLYNAMVSPLTTYPIKGVIWYQGEANVGLAAEYTGLFQSLIHDWREKWNNPDMPFYFVQLANFLDTKEVQQKSVWAELREAQLNALHLDNTGMAVTYDIGEAHDIHPKNKQEVGRRLAIQALGKTYGKNIPYSGPIFKSYQVKGNTIEVEFTHADGGLKAKNGEIKGFAIAGTDHVFHKAKGVVSGNKIIVSAPEVKFPLAVRYGWGDNIESTLYNGYELPASPFRSDNW